ncbi:hypothetical protein QTJ16_000305 [Diplocarpon rosae]|uniref:Partial AB-hydrolase lipase domain-containing protein n=1 Tax=Diplocarpon rosae TaxID=946125 RepID=A0AAD9T525_9HELO|nr:hypothetical protein QTJ16_000305 [Diplocarpon rosae]
MSSVDGATHLTTAAKSPTSSTHSQSAPAQSSAASQAGAPTPSGTATNSSDVGQATSDQSNVAHVASANGPEAQETRATINQPQRNILEPARNDPTIPPEPVITESDATLPDKTPRTSKLPLLAAILKSPRISSRSGVASPASPDTAQLSQPIDAVFTGNDAAAPGTPHTPEPGQSTPSRPSFLAAMKSRGAAFKRNSSHSTNNGIVLHEPVSDQAPTLPPFTAQSPLTDQAGAIRPVAAESSVAAPVEAPVAAAQPAPSKRPFLSDLRSKSALLQQRFAKPNVSATAQTGAEPIVAQTATVPASTTPPTLVIPTRPPRQPAVSEPALGTRVAKDSFVDSLRNRRIATRQAKYAQGTPPAGSTEHASGPAAAPPNIAPPALVIPTRPPRQSATPSQNTTGQKSKRSSLVESIKSRKQAAFSSKSTQPPVAQPTNTETNPAQQNTAPPALIIPTRPPRQPAAPATSTPYRLPFLPKKRSSKAAPASTPAASSTAYPLPSTNPLFPPLPTYGPPTVRNHIKWTLLQILSIILSSLGILVLIISFFFKGLFALLRRLVTRTPAPPRPFQAEEARRAEIRKTDSLAWTKRERQKSSGFPEISASADVEAAAGTHNGYVPTEGGPDKLVFDVGYYARRVGLDSEEVKVQTEDGHVLLLWHVFDPREYTAMTRGQRMIRGPENIDSIRPPSRPLKSEDGAGEGRQPKKQKFPVLMIHGLLQSAGVYCTNDEHSLAFWLCKQGYDVWLGNMRSGFTPEHIDLKPSDPNMWNWDIRHMATLDLPSLTARVLSETSAPKLAVVAHSQGTAASLIALSTSQRPSLGPHLSVLCCLAPAAYAGPLLDTLRFRFLRTLSPSLARCVLGIKSFLPGLALLTQLQPHLPPRWLSGPSYAIVRLLFGWRDTRWDRGVRARNFLGAPTRISATAMLWWLAGGFAAHGSILASREEVQREIEEDLLEDYSCGAPGRISEDVATDLRARHAQTAVNLAPWFDDRSPPVALWVPTADTLCDGAALANRFERGREPAARLVGVTVLEGWGHLDVVWGVDVCDTVGREIRDVVWKTVGSEGRDRWRFPEGCEGVQPWKDDRRVEEAKEGSGE